MESVDSMFREELIKERARRSAKHVRDHGNDLAEGHRPLEESNSISACYAKDRSVIQREDLERIRLNKTVINHLKDSICALSKLTENLGQDVADVKVQHREAANLWKDLKVKFKEISHSLNHSGLLKLEKSKIPRKKRGHDISKERLHQDSESNLDLQKLILPKLESRPNSTPSILHMQIAQQREESEGLNKSMMKNIKKIARKKSQEKAQKDIDLNTDPSIASVKSSTTSFANLKAHSHKSKKCKGLEKRLKEMESLHNQHALSSKVSVNKNKASVTDDISRKDRKHGAKSKQRLRDRN